MGSTVVGQAGMSVGLCDIFVGAQARGIAVRKATIKILNVLRLHKM